MRNEGLGVSWFQIDNEGEFTGQDALRIGIKIVLWSALWVEDANCGEGSGTAGPAGATAPGPLQARLGVARPGVGLDPGRGGLRRWPGHYRSAYVGGPGKPTHHPPGHRGRDADPPYAGAP